MRSALVIATLALTILAAPLPVEQARDITIDERNMRIYGDGTTLNSREADPEALPDGLRSNNRREADPEALPDGIRSNNRREADPEALPDGIRSNNRREADPEALPDGIRSNNKRQEAEW